MEKYIVKQEDLIGEIEGFPIEVVQKMVDYQVEQGNKADISAFQTNKNTGSFDWDKTKEYMGFWDDVIYKQNFDLFFEKYPKVFIPKKGERALFSNDSENWYERVLLAYLDGLTDSYITLDNYKGACTNKEEHPSCVAIWKYAKPLEKKIKELTMKEIAEKFGVDEVKIIDNK